MYCLSRMKVSYKTCFMILKKCSNAEKHVQLRRLYCHTNLESSINAEMKDSNLPMESLNGNSSSEIKGKLGKHIQITSDSYRNHRISEAVVSNIYPLSGTVKGFTLDVLDPEFTFQAGQWVDAFIPNMETVGGFSICSSPFELQEKRTISLGIKHSQWSPAKWFYNECKPGCKISVRVGGDFYYPNNDDEISDLLLIAGGVGVNPIFSIYSHLFYRGIERRTTEKMGSKVCLLYSSKNKEELLFKSKIDAVARNHPNNVHVEYFTTKELNSRNGIIESRVSLDDIRNSLKWLNAATTKVYICGPPSMIEALNDYTLECGIPQSRIYFEKWW